MISFASEFIPKVLDKRAYELGDAGFLAVGKPMENPIFESFNDSFCDEYLNVNWFLSVELETIYF